MSVLEPNPFTYDDPVPPEELIDREAELEQLLTLADGAHNSRLQAPRRYGKTSLLLKVAREAERKGLRVVHVDFLLAATAEEVSRRIREAYERSLQGPAQQILARLTRSWKARAKVAPGGVGGELEISSDTELSQRLADLLDLPLGVLERTGQRTLVIFDEFQDFLRAPGQLDGLLRSKIQLHGDAASYIFSGSEQSLLEEMFGNRERPLFDQARPLYLEPLSELDLGDCITERLERSGREPGRGIDALLDLAAGHPQRAMLLAHHLWEQTARGSTADLVAFDRAIASIDRETGERFEYTWGALTSASQRRVLLALARSEETLYNRRTLDAFELTKGQARSGEDALTKAGEIHRVDGGSEIVDPLLRRWLITRA